MLIHSFQSTGDAYDATQCDENIRRGDLLVVMSECVIGIADTWPVAVTQERGALHCLADGYSFEDVGLGESAKEARALAEQFGWETY